MSKNILDFKNINFSYGKKEVLKNISFSIKEGSFFVLLGLNGAGKSTIFSLITRLLNLQNGEITIDSHSIKDYSKALKDIGIVFQEPTLDLDLTVKQNLYYYGSLKGLSFSATIKSIENEISKLELESVLNTQVRKLNGGHRRRVEILRALINRPKLLLLDEPFSSLDIILRKKMRKFIKDLVKKHNITVIMVSHDILDAYELFDEMILLENGKVLQKGTPQNLYNSPKNKKVANFFGLENIFSGLVKNGIFYSKKLAIFVDFEDEEDICLLIPKNAIEVEEGNQLRIVDSIFIDGKSRVVLENGIIIFLENKPLDSLNINIDKTKVIKLGKN